MTAEKQRARGWPAAAMRAVLVLAASPAAVHAQACPLCYQSAASSSAEFIAALKNGIFVLIIPAFLICATITYVTYRKRDGGDEETSIPEE